MTVGRLVAAYRLASARRYAGPSGRRVTGRIRGSRPDRIRSADVPPGRAATRPPGALGTARTGGTATIRLRGPAAGEEHPKSMREVARRLVRPLEWMAPVPLRRSLQASLSRKRFVADPTSDVVVSMTTFPERLECATLAMECVLRQRCRMKAVVLVLSREQFSEEQLPRSLRRLRRRGVTLLFDAGDRRSFKKLLPTMERFPEDRIITFDDDCLYPKDWVAKLVEHSDRWPGAVIGHFGREMSIDEDGGLHHAWEKAGPSTDPQRLFLIGCAGILYPPHSLAAIAFDRAVAAATCPTEDDSWFFGCSVLAGTERRTTLEGKAPRIANADATASLSDENSGGETDRQFQAVLDLLGIRETVEAPLRSG